MDLKAVDPDINVEGLVDRSKVLDLLVNDEPGVEEKLTSFVDFPYSDSPISATSYELVHLLNIDHIQYGALMSHNSLKTRIRLGGFRFP